MGAPSTSSRRDALLGGRYSLRERIGSGGMASVWLAEDERLGRRVAVKLLAEGLADDEAFTARFRREAQIAAGLTHPSLVGVFDFDPGATRPYLVMEYVPGPNLADRLQAGEPIDLVRLAGDLLGALGAIHRAGVVHRDVKPANVLLAPGGRAMLTDFGIARPEDATSITQAGQMPGTARYMAPELMEGEPASPASDLYSCGVMLLECIGDDQAPAVRDLAEHLASPDPQRRPSTADAALAELDRGSAGPPPSPPPLAATAETEPVRLAETTEPVRSAGAGDTVTLHVRAPRVGAVAAVLGAIAVVVALVVLSGGENPAREALEGRPGQAGGTSAGAQPDAGEATEASRGGAIPAPAPASDPAEAAALNDQGFALIEAGQPEEAIPILRRSVSLFGEDTGDLTYAYALFNLGQALLDAGRAEQAVEVLRRRLEIPNQTDVVRAELEAALAAAE